MPVSILNRKGTVIRYVLPIHFVVCSDIQKQNMAIHEKYELDAVLSIDGERPHSSIFAVQLVRFQTGMKWMFAEKSLLLFRTFFDRPR